jgi:hypothetical protein
MGETYRRYTRIDPMLNLCNNPMTSLKPSDACP